MEKNSGLSDITVCAIVATGPSQDLLSEKSLTTPHRLLMVASKEDSENCNCFFVILFLFFICFMHKGVLFVLVQYLCLLI